MLACGIDVGAVAAKSVILGDGEILGYSILPTGRDVKVSADRAVREALGKAGMSPSIGSVDYVVSTGYGRYSIEYADKKIPEILCHAKGACFVRPSTRFVIDMGGQDSKAIEVNAEGNVTNFAMNDKCAAGTGRFLEVMARALEAESVAEMGQLALQSRNPCPISSTCTVFAETEVVVLLAEGKDRIDLIAGIHKAVSSRVAVMASGLTIAPDAVFTGGVARNIGLKKFLGEEIGLELFVPDEPQIIGALGAALFAQAEILSGKSKGTGTRLV
ncbi:MAG: 2-hydroxyglutaryl-CoA dehydratase [Acidobacteria bacterium]|nr:2-hydroxyglutaryl-CoA dehydratase [Acidobacteriota bacterium]